MGQEYVKYVSVLNAFNAAPQDGLLDEFETVAGWSSGGIGTVTLTRTTTDVFSGAGAMNVAITATGAQSPEFRRILPFPQQRYINFEFAIGQRAGNVFDKRVTCELFWYNDNKNGQARFGFQNWDNDLVNIVLYDTAVSNYITLESNLQLPFEGKTFFIVKGLIDTLEREWVYLDIAGTRYDLKGYALETITDATKPDANNAALVSFRAQSLVNTNTVNLVLDRFKWQGTTYPQ